MLANVTVSGDKAGGWIVDIHDGKVSQTYSPDSAKDEGAAAKVAIAGHIAKYPESAPAFKEPKAETPPEPAKAVAGDKAKPDDPIKPADKASNDKTAPEQKKA